MTLRPYQQHTIELLYEWFRKNPNGDPCIDLPTASGKSIVIAALIEDALKSYPETRVLMLTHVKELIQQNADKLRTLWPNAPIGIYSAGIGRKDVDQITFGGIQSLRGKADIVGHVDLLFVDEAHLISHKDEGTYRDIIKDLREINQRMRVVGLTATPFRLGHGYITDGDALFSDLIKPVSIRELVYGGYLSPLVSRATHARYDTGGIHKRGGEFIEKELQERVDTGSQNEAIAREIVELAGNRKAWLIFCSGVDHSYHMRDELRELGITAETVTGKTPKKERNDILDRYRAGEIRAITNANVLTTGFDYPDIDLIAMLRPTMSAGLYMQMVGRGFRVKSHTDHCLVLDFAGVVAQHGPITAVEPEDGTKEKGDGDGVAPGKECPECHWIIPAAMRKCPNPDCDYEFPQEDKKLSLRDDDIMGDSMVLNVQYWMWEQKVSKSGNDMVVVSYYGNYGDPILREYLLLWNEGFAGRKSMKAFREIAEGSRANLSRVRTEKDMIDAMKNATPPHVVRWERDGKYKRVISREFVAREEVGETS